MADSDAIQAVEEKKEATLAKLPALNPDQDVRRLKAPQNPSPFNWGPVWNRTHYTEYSYNLERDEIRLTAEDTPGHYRIIHVGPTAVSTKVNRVDCGDVATLWQHTGVEVLAVARRPELERIRARIKSPPGWISIHNTSINYRWAVKADTVITVSGCDHAPEVNGRYEHDSNEDDRGGVPYPRYRQVNGDHFLRLCYSASPVWMFTTVREGHPGDEVRCDSRFWNERVPAALNSLPPTFPAAWVSSGVGMHGPMPSLTISYANEGVIRRNPGKTHPVVGVLVLDYGYPPSAEDVYSTSCMGYDVAYRLVPRLTLEQAQKGELSEELERNLRGAIQKLEQKGARAITADCSFLLAFQESAQQMATKPIFTSMFLQWLPISCVMAKEDKFLILTNDEHVLRLQSEILKSKAGLDLKDARFIVQTCKDVPELFDVTKGDAVPSERVEDCLVKLATQALSPHTGARGVFIDSVDLLPYTDAVRSATGLPVWDAVTGAELFTSMYLNHERFEVDDWVAEVLFEYGLQEGRAETGARQRILGIVGLDYENVKVETEYWMNGSCQYKILVKSLLDCTRYLTSLGKLTKACEYLLKGTLKWFQDDVGVCAITGDCGFMMAYQLLVRNEVNVPVFMSPLMFCRLLLPSLSSRERILIITASAPALEEQKQVLLSHCGFDLNSRRYVVLGCEEIEGLTKLASKGEMGSPEVVQRAFLGRIRACLQEWPTVGVYIGAIVMECTQLLPYTDQLRQLSGLPVLDAITCSEFFVAARKDNDRFGIKQWPYVWDRSIEED